MGEFLLIDKEKGWTSFDVVRKVKNLTGEKRVGHAGTLDPLATGLLVVAVGRSATKKLNELLKVDKEYEVRASFGAVSDTFDADGRVVKVSGAKKFTRADIQSVISDNFIGEIEQMPPKYSALKVAGRRACDIMRSGGDVDLKARKIRIDRFEIVDFSWPEADVVINCGSGTYVRSLIHDLGQVLGCGAYVSELRRTKVGEFDVKDSVKI